jgi:hypothetical protein
MVEKDLINIGRVRRTELCVVRKSRVDGSEDGDTLGLIENTRQVRIHGSSGGNESRQVAYPRDRRGGVARDCQSGRNDLEFLE